MQYLLWTKVQNLLQNQKGIDTHYIVKQGIKALILQMNEEKDML